MLHRVVLVNVRRHSMSLTHMQNAFIRQDYGLAWNEENDIDVFEQIIDGDDMDIMVDW